MPSLVPVSRYLFVGPDEKHFDMKKSGKVKKLVYALLDFLVMKKESKFFDFDFEIILKPTMGFTTIVAESIMEYREKHPEKEFKVKLKTELDSNFFELHEKTQTLFKTVAQSLDVAYCRSINYGSTRGAAQELIAHNNAVVFYYEPESKVDKTFEKELKYIEAEKIILNRINFYDNQKGEEYTGTIEGVRKRANGLTYSYRINVKLPTGEKFTEEKANFVTAFQAKEAREIRLAEKMAQEVEPCELTFEEVVKEYIEGKKEQPALQKKYEQYYKSFIDGQFVAKYKLSSFAELPFRLGNFSSLMLRYEKDARYKKGSEEAHYLTDKYKQGYYAFLSNVFDYAYLKGYIPYQPLLIVDLSK